MVRTAQVEARPERKATTPDPAVGRAAPAPAWPWIVASALISAVLGWLRRWNADDAFIIFRVVDQIFAGNGPVFNAGERVEAVTSPLWLALVVAGRALTPLPAEWIAVALGLALSVAGVVVVQLAAATIWRGTEGPLLPAGILVWLALPPVWDFATSGLETGLATAWIASCALGLARAADRVGPRPPKVTGLSVLIGLGPLVRPDFAVFTAAFAAAVWWLPRHPGRRWRMRVLGAVAAPALLTEALRVGYYAALVPNTALAKEASHAWWAQGWRYLVDFIGPYWLGLVVPATLALIAVPLLRSLARRDWPRLLAAGAPLVAGLLYSAAIVRGGGDFMHARMLLPGLLAVITPFALVRARDRRLRWTVAALGVWALACALLLRGPAGEVSRDRPIVDERVFHVARSDHPNPVLLDDYANFERATRGWRLRDLAAVGERTLVLDERPYPVVDGVWPSVVSEAGAIGLVGAAAGTDVTVVDRLGLGDAYGARLRLITRGRPGHEKPLPLAWVVGRFGDPRADASMPAPPEAIRAARRALGCDAIRNLRAATTAPLTPRRVLANVLAAPALTALRFPSDPVVAERELCRSP